MKKHGVDKFTFEILIICFDEDLVKYEKEYIKKYNSQTPNGYNILSGGQIGQGMLGYKHTTTYPYSCVIVLSHEHRLEVPVIGTIHLSY